MKNKYLIAAAALALGLSASPAFADVTATMDVQKEKLVTIFQPTLIIKVADLEIIYRDELTDAATAQALVNSSNSGNRVTWSRDNDPDDGVATAGNPANMGIVRKAVVENAVLRNTGIGQLNQDTGNFANQGNVVSAGLDFGKDAFANAEAYAEQLTFNNSVTHREGSVAPRANPPIDAVITGSFNTNEGVFMGNQNSGNVNSQHNVLALAVADSAVWALSDAGLNQVNAGNSAFETNSVKRDLLTASVNGNTGIVMINQSVGNMNNQATVVSVAALTSAVNF
jgi:predicted nuclease of predicted toxin-antitoxin system